MGCKTLINLVDEYNDHNIVSVLALKPQEVVLIYPDKPQYQDRCNELKDILHKKYGYSSIIFRPFDENTPYMVKNIIQDFDSDGTVVNVSGGSKIASILAYQTAVQKGMKVVCVDIGNRKIVELGPLSRTRENENSIELSVEDIIESTGAEIIKDSSDFYDDNRFEGIIDYFISSYNSWKSVKDLLRDTDRVINYPFDPFGVSVRLLGIPFQIRKLFYELLDKLYKEMLIDGFTIKNNIVTFRFTSKEARSFIMFAGGWLEAVTYRVIKEIRGVDDVRSGVLFVWNDESQAVRNEIDVMAAVDSTLVCISCKDTGNYDTGELNELEVYAQRLGGRRVIKLLVSTEPPQRMEMMLQRAREMNIGVVIFDGDLKAFKSELEKRVGA